MADSWMSSRAFSSVSSAASLRASSRVSVNAARILMKARTTRRRRAYGAASKDTHLHGLRAVEDVSGHDRAMLCEGKRA